MVRAAVFVATSWGVSEMVIGLTVVAVGTSLPELASSLSAAWRGESDIAVGNVVGSNLFNLLLVIGVTAQVSPLPVSDSLRYIDLPIMIGFSLLFAAVLANGLHVKRWEGMILVALYSGFIVWQVLQTTS